MTNSTRLAMLRYRESLLTSRGEAMNANLLRKIRRNIRKYEALI